MLKKKIKVKEDPTKIKGTLKLEPEIKSESFPTLPVTPEDILKGHTDPNPDLECEGWKKA